MANEWKDVFRVPSPTGVTVFVVRGVALAGMSIFYWDTGAQGLMTMFDRLSVKLHRMSHPLVTWMADFEETEGITEAHFAALMLMVFCYASWEAAVGYIGRTDLTVRQSVTWLAAVCLMVLDAFVFWRGLMSSDSFFGEVSGLTAGASTAIWVLVNLLLALFIHRLKVGGSS